MKRASSQSGIYRQYKMKRYKVNKGEVWYDVNKVISLYHKHKHIDKVSEITGINRRTIRRYLRDNNIKKYKRNVREEKRKACGNGMRGKHISDYPKHAEAMNKCSGTNHWKYKPKVKCFCNWCGKELERHYSQIKNVKHINCGSKECKKAQRKLYSGSNSPHWQNGKTKASLILRHSIEYKEFRNRIFNRDNYTCQECGIGGQIEMHHIKEVSNYPELIFNEKNCITLCKKCHRKTNNYASKSIKRGKNGN